jgi:excisionase family DNA binding protein
MEQLYTVNEIAKILKLAVGQVYLYLKNGKLQGIKLSGKGKQFHWRVPESALQDFLGFNKCIYLHSNLVGDEISDYCALFEKQIDSTICNNCKEKVRCEITHKS